MEIEKKFRGKRTDNNQWVYGYFVGYGSNIITTVVGDKISEFGSATKAFHVDPETVGQYIGIKDRNKIEIYEGDFVVCNKHLTKEDYLIEIKDIRNIRDLFGSAINYIEITGNKFDKTIKNYFDDIEKWENSFYCNECGYDKITDFIHARNVANGEVWYCKNCKTEIRVNDKPNEDNY
jgi:uncharacterized phage protein (TIGR01671 family)